MKNTFLILFVIGLLFGCGNEELSRKETVTTYYKAFDSGDFDKIKGIIHDSITIVSGDFVMPFDKDSFNEFYKWDSIFKPSYEILELVEDNDHLIATISQKNIRNEFLKNNPLKLNVKVSFASGKITKLEELDYIEVNWKDWNQEKDSLVNWIKINHPKLDGFVNDMTMTGAKNYLKAIELYEGRG
ncbi:nuclear transport factor 2 family protein [uncultured Maribacter sp.]|uniref:nuclear transport factor 2 family protein n=1 Tax=uncultured Maribacter sp. TaxID=431308 RepID=UPI0026086823|nr:nuclear transport factor 2 family protein [uncultured Maribacter sp.]